CAAPDWGNYYRREPLDFW
nr:immunoglobulin heavy chain junction region [Macaca mulatta]MOW99716.1 immunoglobulin heavy chain junction region [Macaca mulatta]MOX00545.1 immunoglobulin heavy chain junction region [Macaca mulatta]MOX00999.1 immunoglobulin heavy chain junction region [Macaca mulatta]MOX02265.1 immunoglobulin heavy chain junction region [Macaca mulatta]